MEASDVFIDGGRGEGGGQIVRTSITLSALTGRPVEIANVRARRSKPGLQAQHLTSVRAAGALCGATLYNAELGSTYLRFVPGASVGENAFRFDVAEARGGASAGATALVAQTVLMPLALTYGTGARVTLEGGTHVPNAPNADYLEAVYLPALKRMGLDIAMTTERAGFYPKGGGAIHLTVAAGTLAIPMDWTERGRLVRLRAFVTTLGLPAHVAERAELALTKDLKGYGVALDVTKRDLPGVGAGASVTLVAESTNGVCGWIALGERGKPMERVCLEATRQFQKWHEGEAAMDEHLADQLVLPCVLTPGLHRWTTPAVTEHLRTVLHVAQQFLPVEPELTENADGSGVVTVRGVAVV